MGDHLRNKTLGSYASRYSVLVLGRLAGALCLFSVNILIVRFLGIDALADYAVFVSLVGILGVLLLLGFSPVASVFAAEYREKEQPALLRGFVFRAIKTGVATTLTMLLMLGGGRIFFPALVDTATLIFSTTVILTAGAMALLSLNGALHVGLGRPVAGLLPESVVRPVLLLAGTGLPLYLGYIYDINMLFVVTAILSWIALVAALMFNNFVVQTIKNVRAKNDISRWHRAAFPWLGTTLLWDFMIDIVILLSSILMGSTELAILHVCFRYRVLAGFGMRTIQTLLMPEISQFVIAKNGPLLRRKILQSNVASFGCAICVLVGFSLLGNILFGVFSINASEALPVLLVVSATLLIRSIFGPAPLVLALHNMHVATMLLSLAGLVLAGVWIWMFFPIYGVLAAAIGYTGGNLLISISLWSYAKRKTSIDTSIFSRGIG